MLVRRCPVLIGDNAVPKACEVSIHLAFHERPAGAGRDAGRGLQQRFEAGFCAQLGEDLQEDALLILGAQSRGCHQVEVPQLLLDCAQLALCCHA